MGRLIALSLGLAAALPAQATTQPAATADFVWWEAEQTTADNFNRTKALAPQGDQQRAVLSAGAWLCSDGVRKGPPIGARYRLEIPHTGRYELWARKFWRHGPFIWRFDAQSWQDCGAQVALADSAALRQGVCANWVWLGSVELKAGAVSFELQLTCKEGETAVACFDAFVLTTRPFQPRGRYRPGESSGLTEAGHWAFEPDLDNFEAAALDLRHRNEERAGKHGFVRRDGADLKLGDGRRVRFWAVNVGPDIVRQSESAQRYLARRLAKVGVNLVRIHGPVWQSPDQPDRIDAEYVRRLRRLVRSLADHGIYSALSFYFPLWLKTGPETPLHGYHDGQQPFALLFFDPQMQAIYRRLCLELLTAGGDGDPALGADPAVAMIEIQNEDSFFFWTFHEKHLPAPKLELLERQFAAYRRARRGAAKDREPLLSAWHMTTDGFQKSKAQQSRILDQVAFLAGLQRKFYADTVLFLRQDLGCRSLIVCGNWHTADPRLLDSIERWTYTAGDVIDQHGYFGGRHSGPASAYAVQVGQEFADRAGVLEPQALPLRSLQVEGYPQMISELGWPAPNRFRVEMPFLTSVYGALQGIDALCFFCVSTPYWESSPVKFPVALPTILGQFPALSLIYRRGDVRQAKVVWSQSLRLADLLALKGSGVVAEQNLDALRAVAGARGSGASGLHPLAFYVGRVERRFADRSETRHALGDRIDARRKLIRSVDGELRFDAGAGLVCLDTPRAQGAVGFLGKAAGIALSQVRIDSRNEFGSLLVVALDDVPISRSEQLLVQIGTKDHFFGWRAPGGRIESLGGLPIQVQCTDASITLRGTRPMRRMQILDANGKVRAERAIGGARIELPPDCLYVVLTP